MAYILSNIKEVLRSKNLPACAVGTQTGMSDSEPFMLCYTLLVALHSFNISH
jgi:hypothetical protein